MKKFLGAMLALFGLAMGQARADIDVDSIGLAPDGFGNWVFTYSADLNPNSYLSAAGGPGNPIHGFTIYDFAGLAPGLANVTLTGNLATADWVVFADPVLDTYPTQNPPNSPTIENLVFKYVGAGLSNAAANPPLNLGTISITVPQNQYYAVGGFASSATNAIRVLPGLSGISNSTHNVLVARLVPEPSTMVLAGLGGLGLIGYAIRRKRA
jgi:hypothetical protein